MKELLSQQLNLPQIRDVASWAAENPENFRRLWELARSDQRRTGVNALWAMTHLPSYASERISELRDGLIDMLLRETDTAKKRLLLQILKRQDYDPDHIRTDFLDFCLSKINSECEPYAVRCFSLHAAFKMCRHYPELIAELEEHLDMLSLQSLSPGLQSALRQTRTGIKKIRS